MISSSSSTIRTWLFNMLAAATIGAGASDAADIAIIGMNADTNKTFAFVALANVAPSTQIKFTDKADQLT
jgi:hypothetical protein